MSLLSNINFQILLKQHGGNMDRAKKAWYRICSLGGYGNVPPSYEGGLDVTGLRGVLESKRSGQHAEQQGRWVDVNGRPQAARVPLPISPTLGDDIKRIEDLASGDAPK